MAGITVFTNAFLIDCTGKEPIDGAAVVVEGEHIKDSSGRARSGPLKGRVDTLNCKGKTLMSGLTDAACPCLRGGREHPRAAPEQPAEPHRGQGHAPGIEQALMQGFTTVRDAGGADYGFP